MLLSCIENESRGSSNVFSRRKAKKIHDKIIFEPVTQTIVKSIGDTIDRDILYQDYLSEKIRYIFDSAGEDKIIHRCNNIKFLILDRSSLFEEQVKRETEIYKSLFKEDVKNVEEGILEETIRDPLFLQVLNIALKSVRKYFVNTPYSYSIEIVQRRDVEITDWIKRIIKVVVDEITFEESKKLWDLIGSNFEEEIQKRFDYDDLVGLEKVQSIKLYVISKEVADFI